MASNDDSDSIRVEQAKISELATAIQIKSSHSTTIKLRRAPGQAKPDGNGLTIL